MNKLEVVNSILAGSDSGKVPLLTILYIENNRTEFIHLAQQLDPEASPHIRFEIFNATSLGSGLRKLDRKFKMTGRHFDLVLLDYDLPGSNGKEGYLRLAESFPQIPVILVGSHLDRKQAFEMIDQGAQDFLPKDYLRNPELMSHTICNAIERKRRIDHEQLLQQQLIQAEKLDSLGKIAAGVAHEVKNPLAIIRLGIPFLKCFEEMVHDPDFSETLQNMEGAIEDAVQIIWGMVEYSRNDKVALAPMTADKPTIEALKLLSFDIRKSKTTINRIFRTPAAILNLDDGKYKQLIINLVRNSIQAMTSTGVQDKQISISSYSGPIEEFRQVPGVSHWLRGSSSKVIGVIEIRDNGPGVPEDKICEIFEPFFTTKSKEEGTGLGLSVVKKIVGLHDGLIRVKNVENPRGFQTCLYFKALPPSNES